MIGWLFSGFTAAFCEKGVGADVMEARRAAGCSSARLLGDPWDGSLLRCSCAGGRPEIVVFLLFVSALGACKRAAWRCEWTSPPSG